MFGISSEEAPDGYDPANTLASRPGCVLKMRTHLYRFKFFQRAGVGLSFGQAEFRQYVQNPATLDFHLAREIVDTNLTHPPLFKMCFPKPVSCSWLLRGIGCSTYFHYGLIG